MFDITSEILKESESSISTDVTDSSCSTSVECEEVEQDNKNRREAGGAVHFGGVQVREFERRVGFHPDTRAGPPLAIDWAFVEQDPIPLDQFELEYRRSGETMKRCPRITSAVRRRILHDEFGVSSDEMLEAEKQVLKSRKQRQYSNKQGKISAHAESVLLSMRRKVRSVLLLRTQ